MLNTHIPCSPYRISCHKINSRILNKEMSFSVCEASGCEDKPLPTIFFLHGRSGDEQLAQQLGMDKLLTEMSSRGEIRPLRLICPCLDNSRGINSAEAYSLVEGKFSPVHKGRYEDYLIKELIPYIDEHYPVKERMIGGISAGGYTALSLAMRHPTLFSRVGGHMPAIDLCYEDEEECYFADREMWLAYDPIGLAGRTELSGLRFYLDDGLHDEGGFFRSCEKLRCILDEKGIPCELHLRDGHHSGGYVMEHLSEYLRFYAGL